MKITILCIGRLGNAPEAQLAVDWARRAGQVGRAHGLAAVEIVEVEAKKGGKAAEGEALLRRADDTFLIACDEHGEALPSRAIATLISKLRDEGTPRLAIAIGGADGLDNVVLTRAECSGPRHAGRTALSRRQPDGGAALSSRLGIVRRHR